MENMSAGIHLKSPVVPAAVRWFVLLLFVLGTLAGSAQIGGESTYRFLSLTNSARMAALGGSQAALRDSTDLNLPFHNPALLQESMTNQLLVNYVNYMTDINYGYAAFAFRMGKTGKAGVASVGMHYINYGDFIEAGEDGIITGLPFTAGEYALNLMWSNNFRKWRYGVNLKPVLSVFESYQSFGLAADAGVAWFSGNNRTSLGLVARNFGTQITTYYEDGEKEALPLDVMAGFSQKLAHAPILFSVTAHHLNHWDLANLDESEITDEFVIEPQESLGKQIMRHMLLGTEVMPTKNFTLRAGYNYHLRQELKLEQRLSTVGFSLGFGVKIKRFRLDYSTTRYHLAGSSNHISLAINMGSNF